MGQLLEGSESKLVNPPNNHSKVKQKMSPTEIAEAQKKGTLCYRPILDGDIAKASDRTYDVKDGVWKNRMSKADKKKIAKNRKKALKSSKAARAAQQ